jgi:DNA polymerase-3 subunit beta
VRLSFGHGKVTIEAATEGQARARETVDADFAGEETAIAFSPHYLMDGLAAALIAASGAPDRAQGSARAGQADPGEQAGQGPNAEKAPPVPDEARIRLQFTSPTKPALITGSAGKDDEPAPDYRYLVVPLRALAGA